MSTKTDGYCEALHAVGLFYGDDKALRSGQPLINHITCGLQILEVLGAGADTKGAWCVHPMVQDDKQFKFECHNQNLRKVSTSSIMLAVEYRNKANAYLSADYESSDDNLTDIVGCLLPEVRLMLIADKIQNWADFARHFPLDEFPKKEHLPAYYDNWLRYLDISELKTVQLLLNVIYPEKQ